jgi:hypothetical protein
MSPSQLHPSQTKIWEGRTNLSERSFEAVNGNFIHPKRRFWKDEQKMKSGCSKHFFKGVSNLFGLLTIEKSVENPDFIFVHPSKIFFGEHKLDATYFVNLGVMACKPDAFDDRLCCVTDSTCVKTQWVGLMPCLFISLTDCVVLNDVRANEPCHSKILQETWHHPPPSIVHALYNTVRWHAL